MAYSDAAWRRAMTVQEVVLKALSGEIHWFRAADILGMSARTLRRWRERYEQHGYVGLVDKRRHTPSARRPTAPTGPHGGTLTKAVRSLFKRKRSIHLSATAAIRVLDKRIHITDNDALQSSTR